MMDIESDEEEKNDDNEEDMTMVNKSNKRGVKGSGKRQIIEDDDYEEEYL